MSLSESIKLPRPDMARSVAGATVATFDGGILILEENSTLAADIVMQAQQTETSSDRGEFVVGNTTVVVQPGTTSEEQVQANEEQLVQPNPEPEKGDLGSVETGT